MKNVIKICAFGFLFAAIASAGAATSAQTLPPFTRVIDGVVVDKEDIPISGANVCAWGTGPMNGRLPCSRSNSNGQFSIKVDRPDTYRISAEHLAQGYPEAIWGFYGKPFVDFPVVTVDESITLPPVKIKMGPKAGRVIFTILDGETTRPVTTGKVIVSRINDPLSSWSKSTEFPGGKYELLTPDAPFTVRFETWEGAWVKRAAFDLSGLAVEVLQIDLGQRQEITVRLK